MNTRPPTECPAWGRLAASAERQNALRIAQLFERNPQRSESFRVEAPDIVYDFSRQRLDATTLDLLAQLADERGFDEWRRALLEGGRVNSTEQTSACHTTLRAGGAADAGVKAVLARMRELAGRLRGDGRFTRVVHLGTGGSGLGPQLLVDALGVRGTALEFSFAANVDPLDLERALAGAAPERTLFVVVSKSFATEETLANAHVAKRWLGGRNAAEHIIAVTANEAAARAFGATEILPLPADLGGRYSIWSAAGFSAMCAIGADEFDRFLAGAREIDLHFASAPALRNVPVLMALVSVWNVNFLGAPTHAVLPYTRALRLLPAYLQQLEMESNGKRVDHDGRSVGYATAPVVWGCEGTVGQHSFHQLLHQGTRLVPADFIVIDPAKADDERSAMLAAHARAQADALAFGDLAERGAPGSAGRTLPPHRVCPGNQPSSTLTLRRLDAASLGRLLALYEHKVFTQGVVWNVNSFDQWGVELGKRLARRIPSRRT